MLYRDFDSRHEFRRLPGIVDLGAKEEGGLGASSFLDSYPDPLNHQTPSPLTKFRTRVVIWGRGSFRGEVMKGAIAPFLMDFSFGRA